jgi:hypothetical protein
MGQVATFQIGRVIPRIADGATEAGNLALARVSCLVRKWARLVAPDPESGAEVPLFNSRAQRRQKH